MINDTAIYILTNGDTTKKYIKRLHYIKRILLGKNCIQSERGLCFLNFAVTTC